jgi:hypothetical protein
VYTHDEKKNTFVRYANIAWCSLERTWAIIWERHLYYSSPSLCVVHIIWYSSRLYSTFIDYYDTRPRGDDIHTGAGLLNKKKMLFCCCCCCCYSWTLFNLLFVCLWWTATDLPFYGEKTCVRSGYNNIVVDTNLCAQEHSREQSFACLLLFVPQLLLLAITHRAKMGALVVLGLHTHTLHNATQKRGNSNRMWEGGVQRRSRPPVINDHVKIIL